MVQLMLSVSHWRRKKKCLCLAAYTRIPSCLHWKLFHNPPPTQLILLKFCLDLINVIPVHSAARSALCYMAFPLDFIIQPATYWITSLELRCSVLSLMWYFTDLECPSTVWLCIFSYVFQKRTCLKHWDHELTNFEWCYWLHHSVRGQFSQKTWLYDDNVVTC